MMIVGTGIDIVDIGRLRKTLDRQRERFLRRVYTIEEQQFCDQRRDPVPHYAARFAAKEAFFKALGTGWAKGVSWLDVEVRRAEEGPPGITVCGEAERIAGTLKVQTIHLSLSHSAEAAVAVVILET